MSQLVFIENNQAVTDSLTVAEVFEKRHADVKRDIRNLVCSSIFNQRNFALITYIDSRGREQEKVLITQDGFSFLVMGYTGAKAAEFKEKYISEFSRMKEHIQNSKVTPLSKDQALVTVLRTTADLVEGHEELKSTIGQYGKKILEIESKVDEQITLDHGEQRRLQKGVAAKVYEICDDPNERPKLFKEIYREIKDRFGVASYKDVKRKELQSAIRYIENWIPKKVS